MSKNTHKKPPPKKPPKGPIGPKPSTDPHTGVVYGAAPFANQTELSQYTGLPKSQQNAFQAWRAKDPSHRTWAQWLKHTGSHPATTTPGTPGKPGVGPGMDPADQQQWDTIFKDFGEQRDAAEANYADYVEGGAYDKQKQAEIASGYAQAVNNRGTSLASRGLSSRGVSAADLVDVDRTRDLNTANWNRAKANAKTIHDNTIARINANEHTSWINYNAKAGQQIEAPTDATPDTTTPGTGIFAPAPPPPAPGYKPPGGVKGKDKSAPPPAAPKPNTAVNSKTGQTYKIVQNYKGKKGTWHVYADGHAVKVG